MDRCRNPSSTVYKGFTGIGIYRHNRGMTEKSSKLHSVSYLLADGRDHTDCRCFLIDHTDRHFICDHTG